MRMGLAIIYQELNLVNTMTVGENVFLGRFGESGGRRGVHAKARKLLDSIGSKVSTHRMVSELSVSDKQMVEIAKALSFDSKLIIMDEPSSSLTADEMEKLVKIIHDLKSKGIAIIYISHKLDEIFGFCDVVTVMRDGHVIDTRPVSEMYSQPDDLDDGRPDHRERVPAAAGERGRDDPRDQAHEHPEAEGRPAHPAQGRDPRPRGSRRLRPNGAGASPVRGRQGRQEEHLPRWQARRDQQPDRCHQPRSGHGAGGAEAPGPAARVLRRAEHLACRPGPIDRVRLPRLEGGERGQRPSRSRRSTSRRHPAGPRSGHCPAGTSRRRSWAGGWR